MMVTMKKIYMIIPLSYSEKSEKFEKKLKKSQISLFVTFFEGEGTFSQT
jgi:hypothetical protein